MFHVETYRAFGARFRDWYLTGRGDGGKEEFTMARNVKVTCECSDPGCPVHQDKSECERKSVTTVYRIDMEDKTGTRMCRACSKDAMDSGVFTTK